MKKIAMIAVVIMILIVVGMFFINDKKKDTEVTEKRTRVGILFNGTTNDKGWGQSHYEGINKSAKELNLEIIYKEEVPFDATCMDVMKKMIGDGCEIIICNSYDYGEWMLKVAEEYPDITFFHATGVKESSNVATYFGRMYQMRYLSGIVAGLQTETNAIGYVAAFPISEVNRGINAFTLGVRSVNPKAVVHVAWSESWTDDKANTKVANELIDDCNVDILTMHCDTVAPLQVAEDRGIWSIGYNMDNSESYPNSFLTAAVWKWENFYTPQILKCLQDKFYSAHHWDGVESGLMELAPFTKNVKAGIAEKVEKELERLKNGTYDVFYGPVVDSEGNVRVREDENMPDKMMLSSFDWYVEGVKQHEKQ